MSTIKYDNIFTDRVAGNKSDQGMTLLNLTSDLNNKFWIEIKNENNVSSIFFKVKQFSLTDSEKIIDGINEKKDVFFDSNGNITIRENESSVIVFQWKNNLSKSEYTTTEYDNIFYRKDSNELKRKITLPRTDFILSNDSNWILYTKDNICYVLYNPLHRKVFKNYYNNILNFTQYQDNGGKIDKLFNMYCSIQKKRNQTENDIREYSDRSCNCIITEDGIDDMTGIRILDPTFRNAAKINYFCLAPSCFADNLEISENSFMFNSTNTKDGYRSRRIRSEYGDVGCPEKPVTICNVALSSQGNINLVGTNLAQTCGIANQNYPTPPPSSTTSPPSGIVNLANASFFIKSGQVLLNNEDFKNKLTQNLLAQDNSLTNVNIYITELEPYSYKIDIRLNKQIQMIKSNILKNIFTSETVSRFNIIILKEFEDTDIPKKSVTENKSSFNMFLVIIAIFVIIIAVGSIIMIIL